MKKRRRKWPVLLALVLTVAAIGWFFGKDLAQWVDPQAQRSLRVEGREAGSEKITQQERKKLDKILRERQ